MQRLRAKVGGVAALSTPPPPLRCSRVTAETRDQAQLRSGTFLLHGLLNHKAIARYKTAGALCIGATAVTLAKITF